MRSERFTLCLFLTTLVIFAILLQPCGAAEPSSVIIPTPLRTLYVSPSGTGQGTSPADPMSITAALGSSQPGDLFWLLGGTYTGLFYITRGGTSSNPIIWRAAQGAPHVTIKGGFEITGANNWIWGMEITDPNELYPNDSGVRILAAGTRIINNVVHDHSNKNGIGAWNTGGGQVIYGNIVYSNGQGLNHPHNIYTQNDYVSNGYKYFTNNMLLDSTDVCANCFNFHAYTETGYVTGMNLQNNIIKHGRFLIGGYNVPADNEVVKNNYFYDSQVQFGYRRPTQVSFQDNYVVRATLDTQWFWGDGEVQYTEAAPNVFSNNQFLLPPNGVHVLFRTSAYLSTGRCEGCPPIRQTDTFNNNSYSTPFRGTFYANNQNLGTLGFSSWKSACASAGNAFDSASAEVSTPSGSKVVILNNEYESGRAHLAIYNYALASSVPADLSGIVPAGAAYKVFGARSVYGTPVLSGTYSGPISVPMSGQEFAAFLVTFDGSAPPPSAGTLSFDASSYSVNEGAGTASVTITRSGGSYGAVSVSFATSDGTAGAGADYTAETATVSFADADTAPKTVQIPILDDALLEGNETVNLRLSNPTGGAALGTSSGVLTIVDNDVAPPPPSCLFCDDFEDGSLSSSWSASPAASWTESSGRLNDVTATRSARALATGFAGCRNCSIETTFQQSGGANSHVSILGWYAGNRDYVDLIVREGKDAWVLKQSVGGTLATIGKASFPVNPNQPYLVKIQFDGTVFTVTVNGAVILTARPAGAVQTGTAGFDAKGTTASFDDLTVN